MNRKFKNIQFSVFQDQMNWPSPSLVSMHSLPGHVTSRYSRCQSSTRSMERYLPCLGWGGVFARTLGISGSFLGRRECWTGVARKWYKWRSFVIEPHQGSWLAKCRLQHNKPTTPQRRNLRRWTNITSISVLLLLLYIPVSTIFLSFRICSIKKLRGTLLVCRSRPTWWKIIIIMSWYYVYIHTSKSKMRFSILI